MNTIQHEDDPQDSVTDYSPEFEEELDWKDMLQILLVPLAVISLICVFL